MSDLEQKCEEALFVLCDARERYPTKCAEEFGNCIRLTSEICMAPCAKSTVDVAPIIAAFTADQNEFLEAGLAKRGPSLASLDERVHKMLDQINNLKEVMEQVKRDKADTRFTYI